MVDNVPEIFLMGLQERNEDLFWVHLPRFNLQEELLNGYKVLCEQIVKPKLKDYFKEMPKTPFE